MNKLLFITIYIFAIITLSYNQELKLKIIEDLSNSSISLFNTYRLGDIMICGFESQYKVTIPKKGYEIIYKSIYKDKKFYEQINFTNNLTNSESFNAGEQEKEKIGDENQNVTQQMNIQFSCDIQTFIGKYEDEKFTYINTIIPDYPSDRNYSYVSFSIDALLKIYGFKSYETVKEGLEIYLVLHNRE